ncbi:sugar phosphate isomerase/epimerase [Streptomyces sp. NBC_01340]|uniref:TIM barrel protein n=1 Tax=Streptomyces sp. NBC_01549 TaxID=2975874 RepID=UPI002259A716|nr:TIM barrel protein [Streptomyces sp. NBC_01549]MCX4452064.1 sugar phosphate isomerase/epimerase [Streptomyces sp. NBC_01719]MCX4491424.1 sugar phosphate isomerase/epimerase [Streptomyces sp. NBC_01728]MCX4594000.1 sugar phosphate isomerase/epimerase [Streptomyces sp. NBC_01549]WSI44003.1 sugar phosphate isomerase/epimerase [Streptomyces sp. NBC_01340]
MADEPWDLDVWAKEFATLAAQADGVGARLGVEPLPWSNLKTVHDGIRLVETAGHPAGGLIIDVWHTERAHTPPASRRTARGLIAMCWSNGSGVVSNSEPCEGNPAASTRPSMRP